MEVESRMEVSRRAEPFRYTMEPALACLIRPYELNRHPIDSKPAEAELLDLSPKGCKLDCSLNFRTQHNECKLEIAFQLEGSLKLRGTIVWQEVRAHGFRYGIRFEEGAQQLITDELKRYSRRKIHSKDEPS